MKREFGLDQISKDSASVVTVGTFDGVHLGHQAILRYLVKRAREQGGRSVVLTFDPHPRQVVHGEDVPLLTTVEERADAMEHLGIDRFIVIPFTLEFSRLQAEEFVTTVLVDRIGLQEIVIGYDHAFGRDRRGDAAMLEDLGGRHGFTVDVIPAQIYEEHVVSSSELRQIIAERGEVDLAASMLGRPYSLNGRVVEGEGRGRQIGYPTANLRVDNPMKVIPAVGVYAVRVEIDGTTYRGMMNIGHRPTFGEGQLAVEVHILDLNADLYGRDLRVEFVARMRDERKFSSLEALIEQLSKDRQRCIDLLGG